MIIEIKNSDLKDKKYMVTLDDNRVFHFGSKYSNTYLDHKDDKKRENYLKRHMANKREKYLIENNIPSPSLFSAKLLWSGPNLEENVINLNKLLKRSQ
jgi:hypothetical protein